MHAAREFELPPEDARWQILTQLFEKVLAAPDPVAFIESLQDAEIRDGLATLWRHHQRASQSGFLGKSFEFQILPMFEPGQTLMSRFDITRRLGVGGMGEVYLAFDRKLGEEVAIKTVARLLTHSIAIRHRFLSEVQNARRVTHPNVCRIYDLFEDGETAFFSMEYVDGEPLNLLLSRAPLPPAEAKAILSQLADGLHTAHNSGVVHGDFKPANIMVVSGPLVNAQARAVIMDFGLALALGQPSSKPARPADLAGGTLDYMAPELLAGESPTHLSDIFAFGKVANLLLPGRKMWRECTQPEPRQRVQSLAQVLAYLHGQKTRRLLIAGALLTPAAYLAYRASSPQRLSQMIEANARLLVNGFHTVEADVRLAQMARGLLVTGLQQSPRVRVIADADLLKSLQILEPAASLPAAPQILHRIALTLQAPYWLEAQISKASGRYSLVVDLIRSHDGQTVSQTHFADTPSVAPLAAAAALWIRKIAGESDGSLALNSADAETFTSKVPEALESYYAAMNFYAVGKMEEAIPLLQEAVRLDPNFAQALNILGMCFNTINQIAEAFPLLDRAHRLARSLPVRERCWVDGNYYGLVEDPDLRIKFAQDNVDFHPGEPRFYRILARELCWADRAGESIAPIRQAIALAPGRGLFESELIFNLSEAGRFAEALEEYRRFKAAKIENPYLDYSAGFALTGLERYQEAAPYLKAIPNDPELRYQGAKLLAGQVESAIADLQQSLARAGELQNPGRLYKSHEFLCAAYYLTDRPAVAQTHLVEMADLPAFPPFVRLLQGAIWWAHRLEDDFALQTAQSRLQAIAGLWPNGLTKAAFRYSQSVQSFRQGDSAGGLTLLNQSLGAAFTLWAAWQLADYYTGLGQLDAADEAWRNFEDRRGTLLKLWSPCALLLAWANHAAVARARGDSATAKTLAKKILNHWSGPYSRSQLTLKAESSY